MEILYLDQHFFLNLAADYLLLLAAARVLGLVLRRLRYLAGALLGALYAVLVMLPGFGFLATMPGKLLAALGMGLLAYGGEKRFLRCTIVFLGVSALFGGAFWALGLSSGAPVSLPLPLLLGCFALCYGALQLFYRAGGKLPETPRAEVCICLAGREASFMVLLDSGNSLCDPASGKPILVACPHAVKKLFPGLEEALSLQAPQLLALSSQFPLLQHRFRLIPYRALGSTGMLAAFRPDSVRIDGKSRPDLLIALSESAAGDGYEGIV